MEEEVEEEVEEEMEEEVEEEMEEEKEDEGEEVGKEEGEGESWDRHRVYMHFPLPVQSTLFLTMHRSSRAKMTVEDSCCWCMRRKAAERAPECISLYN